MDKTVVELRDAEAHFERLSPLIRAGRVITICEQNKPLAEIRPLARASNRARRPFGLARGTFSVPQDFNAEDSNIERSFYSDSK